MVFGMVLCSKQANNYSKHTFNRFLPIFNLNFILLFVPVSQVFHFVLIISSLLRGIIVETVILHFASMDLCHASCGNSCDVLCFCL